MLYYTINVSFSHRLNFKTTHEFMFMEEKESIQTDAEMKDDRKTVRSNVNET